MEDSPQAMAERLTRFVDELLQARKDRHALAIRGRTQMVLRVLQKLRDAHAESPLEPALVSRIKLDKTRAQLVVPTTSEDYQNVCWECSTHGKEVVVDKRVDPVCKSCGWVQCSECGA